MKLKPYFMAFSCLLLCLSCSSDDLNRDEILQNDCRITQGISPNQDGLNDNFDLSCLADRSGISILEIFDRNGIKIYEQNDYRDEFIGQTDDGEDLVTGTYFYAITFEAEDPEYGTSTEGSLYINVEQ
ncbi:gliding motility-associated C-terminal domain-containing protein [Psychroflexus tropicus]|uniref:T9SS type B sorting domain-containing protein n=1 Tax=Psychroflexus tropicus TaxID=197345 RepID=UPI000368C925|nr:gliding motility-associated C-terminal domain-containing protein [Psychroflexus tropicus]